MLHKYADGQRQKQITLIIYKKPHLNLRDAVFIYKFKQLLIVI